NGRRGGGGAGRSSGRNGTIFGSGFGGAAGGAAAAGFTGSTGAGGVTGATREGSGTISIGFGTIVDGGAGVSAGLGLTIIAAGVTSIPVSSSSPAGWAFFARTGFLAIGRPSGPSSAGAFGFATRLGLTSSGSSRPLPSLVRRSLASFASRGVMARTPL